MENPTDFQVYINEIKKLYNIFHEFIEKSDDYSQNFEQLINCVDTQKLQENEDEFEHFLRLIAGISNYHCRRNNLIEKVEQVLQHYKEKIKQTYSSTKIFNIFKGNKIILLYLIQNEFMTINEDIYLAMTNNYKDNETPYCYFFLNEIKSYNGPGKIDQIDQKIDPTVLENYEEKRKSGENDSYICKLIREDSIEEFVSYVNQLNIPLNSHIKPSIYETNIFLILNQPTLIQYAVFYGSNQIIDYLQDNKVALDSSLWLYAIYGQNEEIIYLLEEKKIEQNNDLYQICFNESIKCHHNDLAYYIKSNYTVTTTKETHSIICESHNFKYFSTSCFAAYILEFYYLCVNNFYKIVNLYIKHDEQTIKEFIISNIRFFFFNEIPKKIFFSHSRILNFLFFVNSVSIALFSLIVFQNIKYFIYEIPFYFIFIIIH